MGYVIISSILLVSSFLIYTWSYRILWFKMSLLFDDISAVRPNGNMSLSSSGLDKNTSNQNPGYNEQNKDTFTHKFYAEYSLSSKRLQEFIRVVFSLAMVSYVLTIEIVLWQIRSADITQSGDFITNWIWPLISMCLSVILILVQPFFILISLLNKFFNDRFDLDRLVIITSATLMIGITLLKVLSIGPFKYSSNILTRLSISGVTVMAILSGIASVSTIYYTFLYFWKQYKYMKHSPAVENYASNSIRNRKLLIWARKSWVNKRLLNYETKIDKCVMEMKNLQNENLSAIAAENRKNMLLESIGQYQLQSNTLTNLLKESAQIRLARKYFELGFLIYCCYRILLTFFIKIPKIWQHFIQYPFDYNFDYYKAASDPLAVTLANILDFFLFHFNYQHDLDSLTSQISLLLSASLFICALSTVNTTVSFLLSLLPLRFQVLAMFAMQDNENLNNLPTYKNKSSFKKAPSMIKNLLVSELTGIYVIATILMIKSNLPFDVATKLKNMLGQKFTVTTLAIDCWFDEIYALSCILTFAFIKLAERTVYLVNKNDRLSS